MWNELQPLKTRSIPNASQQKRFNREKLKSNFSNVFDFYLNLLHLIETFQIFKFNLSNDDIPELCEGSAHLGCGIREGFPLTDNLHCTKRKHNNSLYDLHIFKQIFCSYFVLYK